MFYYLFIQGSVRGPYSDAELREMLEHREIPSDVQACRVGTSEWQKLGNCLGLPSVGSVSILPPAAAARQPDPECARTYVRSYYKRATEEEIAAAEQGERSGIGRGAYFLGLLGVAGLERILNPGQDMNFLTGAILFALAIGVVMLRLRNMQKNVWLAFLILVPLANIYLGTLCLVAPNSYGTKLRLDALGKALLAIVILVYVALLVGALSLAVH